MKRTKAPDMTGKKFYYLTVISRAGNLKYGAATWNCLCDCGKTKVVAAIQLNSGGTKSCGCQSSNGKSKASFVHGLRGTKEYHVWANLKARCSNPNLNHWHNYGGRGISYCERRGDFKNFLSDMGYAPFKKAQLDRIDNNGDYTPENCRWTTPQKNAQNTRRTRNITLNGETHCMEEWKKITGIKSIQYRLNKGWPIEKALTKNPLYRDIKKRPH